MDLNQIPPAKIIYYNLKYKHKTLWHCKLWLEALLHNYCGALVDMKRKTDFLSKATCKNLQCTYLTKILISRICRKLKNQCSLRKPMLNKAMIYLLHRWHQIFIFPLHAQDKTLKFSLFSCHRSTYLFSKMSILSVFFTQAFSF